MAIGGFNGPTEELFRQAQTLREIEDDIRVRPRRARRGDHGLAELNPRLCLRVDSSCTL